MIKIKGKFNESEELEKELSRYTLIKEDYIQNRGREDFNNSYLLEITDRLIEISFSDETIPEELQKKSDELLEFFAAKSEYI